MLNDVERDYSRFQNLLKQAGGITYSVQSINHAFSQSYPVSINSTTSDRQMIDSVRQLWQDSLSAFKHSLTLGAGGRQVLAEVQGSKTSSCARVSVRTAVARRIARNGAIEVA